MQPNHYHVLNVNNEVDVLEQLDEKLHAINIGSIKHVKKAKEVIDLIRDTQNTYDLIIYKLTMPEIDGIQFLRLLYNHKFQGKIIFLTDTESKIHSIIQKLAKSYHLNLLGYLKRQSPHTEIIKLLDNSSENSKIETIMPSLPQFSKYEFETAISNNEFIMFYQPKVCIKTKKLVSFESLLRWHHPSHKFIDTENLILQAENHKLIHKITCHVIKTAIAQRAKWDHLDPSITMAINLSAQDLLLEDLPNFIEAKVEKHNLRPDQFILEVTEKQLNLNSPNILNVLSTLIYKNFIISIDDFGAGFAGIKRLEKIPSAEIKIDKTFVHNIDTNPVAQAILETSVILAKKLGLKTVAEGIETESDWARVKNAGVDIAQGNYISAPLSPKAALSWVEQWNKKHG